MITSSPPVSPSVTSTPPPPLVFSQDPIPAPSPVPAENSSRSQWVDRASNGVAAIVAFAFPFLAPAVDLVKNVFRVVFGSGR